MKSGNLRIIELLNDQQALIKVVNDKDWNSFMQRVSASEDLCMATSTSLLPPRGRFMRLFSQANRACGGVIWDISADCYGSCTFQNQQYFAWPSGYYAKTEFNLIGGKLKNGRDQHLVTIEQLRQQNIEIMEQQSSKRSCEQLLAPFNEVITNLQHLSLRAVFCRTAAPQEVVFMMGVRNALQRVLEDTIKPAGPKDISFDCGLPIVLIDTKTDARLITDEEQQLCVRWCIEHNSPRPQLHPQRHLVRTQRFNLTGSAFSNAQKDNVSTHDSQEQISPNSVMDISPQEMDGSFALDPPLAIVQATQPFTIIIHARKDENSTLTTHKRRNPGKWLKRAFLAAAFK
jgi:hypothetical protein